MRKASVVSMNSIFNHVGPTVGSNVKLDESTEPWVPGNSNKRTQNYYGTWKNQNLAMPWAMIVISFVQVLHPFHTDTKFDLHSCNVIYMFI